MTQTQLAVVLLGKQTQSRRWRSIHRRTVIECQRYPNRVARGAPWSVTRMRGSHSIPANFDSGQSIGFEEDVHLWAHADTPSATLDPPLPVRRQPRNTEWCWAVVVTSMHNHLDQDHLKTCTLVERVRPGNSCCTHPTSDICRQPDEVARHLADLGNADGEPIGAGISWAKVQHEISRNRPIAAIVSYQGGAHAVVICGWAQTDGQDYLIVMDPQAGALGIEFGEFNQGYPPGGTWAETNLTRRNLR